MNNLDLSFGKKGHHNLFLMFKAQGFYFLQKSVL